MINTTYRIYNLIERMHDNNNMLLWNKVNYTELVKYSNKLGLNIYTKEMELPYILDFTIHFKVF